MSPVGLGKLQDMKSGSFLVAAVPVVFGVCLPSSLSQLAGRREEFAASVPVLHSAAWGDAGMQEPPEFADTATETKRDVGRLGEVSFVRNTLSPQAGQLCKPQLPPSHGEVSVPPTSCVQHGRGMFPGSKSQNANFQSKNGL